MKGETPPSVFPYQPNKAALHTHTVWPENAGFVGRICRFQGHGFTLLAHVPCHCP